VAVGPVTTPVSWLSALVTVALTGLGFWLQQPRASRQTPEAT
jgi:lysozyme family protein